MSGNERTMSPAHLDDARCADLALGLMPASEREAALAHAASCPACEARLRAHVSASERAAADWAERVESAARVPALAPRGITLPGSPAPVRPAPVLRHPTAFWRDARVLTSLAAAVFILAVAWPLLT